MKNLKTALLCAAAVTIMSAPAKAGDNFYFKPYVGAEYQHTIVDYASVDGISFDDVYEDNFNGGGIYLGARKANRANQLQLLCFINWIISH